MSNPLAPDPQTPLSQALEQLQLAFPILYNDPQKAKELIQEAVTKLEYSLVALRLLQDVRRSWNA